MFNLLALNTKKLLYPLITASLNNVPFHNHTDALTRYVPEKFPLHLAIHEISALKNTPPEYTRPHLHEDEDEINMLLSSSDLRYRIMIGSDIHIVTSNTAIFIPKGVLHSANVLNGDGFFVTIRV